MAWQSLGGRCPPGWRSRIPALLACAAGVAVSGCSINFPMSSLVADPETTASIVAPASPSQLGLTEEDWVQASIALDKALDPQQAGAGVRWSNPDSGRAGQFVATGPAFVRNDQICRAFKASLAPVVPAPGPAADQRLLGTACRAGAGAWTLLKVKPLPEAG